MLALRSLRDLRIFLFLKSPPPRVNGPAASQAGGGGRELEANVDHTAVALKGKQRLRLRL